VVVFLPESAEWQPQNPGLTTAANVRQAMASHVLERAEFIGLYQPHFSR